MSDEHPYRDVLDAIVCSPEEWETMDWRTQSWYVWYVRSTEQEADDDEYLEHYMIERYGV